MANLIDFNDTQEYNDTNVVEEDPVDVTAATLDL